MEKPVGHQSTNCAADVRKTRKILISWDHYSQYMENKKIKNVPNHQPVNIYLAYLAITVKPTIGLWDDHQYLSTM